MTPTSEEHLKNGTNKQSKAKTKSANQPVTPLRHELPEWKMVGMGDANYTATYGAIKVKDGYAGPDGA